MKATDPLTTISAWQDVIRSSNRVVVHGAGTKVTQPDDEQASILDGRSLNGIIEYDPSEFTFTALAGTPLSDIESRLSVEGQHMPFDPPLVQAGATLGGTVAAGLNGACRLAHGGIRDFILGIRFLDGHGETICAGGRVVKNSAGFDLPKFFVGSAGSFGVLTELTFKVFPRPPSFATLHYQFDSLSKATHLVSALQTAAIRLDALELEPPGRLSLRFGGEPAALDSQISRLRTMFGSSYDDIPSQDDEANWRAVREYEWYGNNLDLVKIPMILADVTALEKSVSHMNPPRRYGAACNVAWIAAAASQLEELDQVLTECGLSGRVVRGSAAHRWLGAPRELAFAQRVKMALDPNGKFPPL